MKVQNLLYQPLELDFGKGDVDRFNSREIRDMADEKMDTEVFKRNAQDLRVLIQTKPSKKKASDTEEQEK